MTGPNGTRAVHVDKIASCTAGLGLERTLTISDDITAERGHVVAVRALEEKRTYDVLELPGGRLAKIRTGDVIAGVLGERRALKGFVGRIPESIAPGDRLHVLNLGGVLGRAASGSRDVGKPLEVEVLGMGVAPAGGRPLHLRTGAIPPVEGLADVPPVVVVAGTCMNSGKTQAACRIIHTLTSAGMTVAAAKLTGVACLRDTLNMEDYGALEALSFLDCGLASTVEPADGDGREVVRTAHALLNRLSRHRPDVIVVEMGDGIIGGYGVDRLLQDAEFRGVTTVTVMTAHDLVGAQGSDRLMREWDLPVDVFSGPCTDSDVGVDYIENELGVRAANALDQPDRLATILLETLDAAGVRAGGGDA